MSGPAHPPSPCPPSPGAGHAGRWKCRRDSLRNKAALLQTPPAPLPAGPDSARAQPDKEPQPSPGAQRGRKLFFSLIFNSCFL